MDALPGSPQIQNIIPTTFFHTTTWAAPVLGVVGAVFVLIGRTVVSGMAPTARCAAGESYGTGHSNEPEAVIGGPSINPLIALLPLVVVGVANSVFTWVIPQVLRRDQRNIAGRNGQADRHADQRCDGHLGGGRRAAAAAS